ncbi:hypothetical protein [Ahrensia kielensis]|uniref:hypothetical protein n=1 Tax=Ahrensia kielensis TaxID=76980 RepID=UPI000367538A|nr:hypothetical protein [Ahrensia kielensis]
MVFSPSLLALFFTRSMVIGAYDTYLTVLFTANVFTLLFEINDLHLWLGVIVVLLDASGVYKYDRTPTY